MTNPNPEVAGRGGFSDPSRPPGMVPPPAPRRAGRFHPAGRPAWAGVRHLRGVADAVHSGSGRTALTDDNTDYYPCR